MAINFVGAWKKQKYRKSFISKLIDCAGKAGGPESCLGFARVFNDNM